MSFTESRAFLNEIRALLLQKTGIFLDDSKDTLILNRLRKLIKHINAPNADSFLAQISHGNNEQEFINAFTTNKTDFFREGFQFLDLLDRVMPQYCNKNGIHVLCAASSTGEEPYSIAATLLYAKEIYGLQSFKPTIIATDIDTEVLEWAQNGVYTVNTKISPQPTWIDLDKYFNIRQIDAQQIYMEAKPCLKSLVTFKQLNLYNHRYPFAPQEFDIIFCRNVLIYFKVSDQKQILKKLFSHLKLNGTLYLGHSESILDLADKVSRLGQNTFVKNRE